MRYTKNNWKKRLRNDLFGWLPPRLYFIIFPMYFKIVNKKRRESSCRFQTDNNGRMFAVEGKNRLYFLDHRRLDRYMYKNGLQRIKNIMYQKYCYENCVINNDDIVVEVGANIGEFTMAAADKAKKVFTFEPDKNCIDCLRLNTNHLKNIEISQNGVSDENGKKTFYISSEDADSSLIQPKQYTDTIEIEVVRLDTWMQHNDLAKIDFLKLEAEGAELEVLIGLGDRVKDIKKISVDGGPERYGKPTFMEVEKWLSSHGFQTKIKEWHVFAWK